MNIKKTLCTLVLALTAGCTSASSKTEQKNFCKNSLMTHNHTLNHCAPHYKCMQEIVQYAKEKEFAVDNYFAITDEKQIRELLKYANDVGLHCVSGDFYKRMGETKPAIMQYNQAEQFENAGDLLEEEKEVENAKACYEKAFEIAYKTNKCPQCAVRIAAKLGDPKRITNAKRKLMRDYAMAGEFSRAAEIARDLGDLETAIDYLERGEIVCYAGELCEKIGDKERAIANYEKTTGENKTIAKLAAQISDSAIKNGEYRKAIIYAAKAGENGDKSMFSTAARLAQSVKDYEKAIEYYQKSGEYDFCKEDLLKEAKGYLSMLIEQGELKDAKNLAKTIGEHPPLKELAQQLKKGVEQEILEATDKKVREQLRHYADELQKYVDEY